MFARPVITLFLVIGPVLLAGPVAAQDERRQVSELLRGSRFDEALSRLEPLLETSPQNSALLTLRGMALLGLGRQEDAAASLHEALSRNPDYLPALQMLVQVEFAARDENAAATLAKIVALRPDDAGAHAMLADLAAERQDCATALTHFEKARPAFNQNPSRLWPQAACLFETGRLAEAEEAYRLILNTHQEDSQARFNLALTQFRRQDYRTAAQTLAPAANIEATSEPDVLSLLADAYEGAGQIPEALKTLQRAVKIHPSEEQLYLQLAELCVSQGSYDLADEVLEAALLRLGSSPRLYAMRGVVYSQLGQFEQSEKAFEQASLLNAGNEMTTMGLTLTLEQGGRFDEAVELLREQLRKSPQQPTLNYMLAQALLKQGAEPGQDAFEEAQRALEISVENDPNRSHPRVTLGQLYLRSGELTAAIAQLERAIELDPTDSTAGYQLAMAFLKAGRKDEAAALVEKVRHLVNEERQSELAKGRHRLMRAESPSQP